METKQILAVEEPKGSSFINTATSLHLLELGFPEVSLNSILKCGQKSEINCVKYCSCDFQLFNIGHRCNSRLCSICAKTRKRRIIRKYLPFFKKLKQDRTNFVYFLTISPQNYSDLNEGIEDIKKSFSKFLRHKYIKERIKGSLYVIETKGGVGDWNIHIHALIYGRWLDNRLRGRCLDCNQNLLKYDKNSKNYFCANRFCNSKNVLIKEKSKITRLFEKSSKRDSRLHIQRQGSFLFSLNYMCKYISANKDDFNSDYDLAVYMNSTRNHRLINSTGIFYNLKFSKVPLICSKCGSQICYCNDSEILSLFEKQQEEVKPQKSLGLFLVSEA